MCCHTHCCQLCGKRCKTVYLLNKHVAAHSNVKVHQCDVCGKQFQESSTLKLHTHIHIVAMSYQYTQTTAYSGNIHAAAVNASEISKYNKDTKCHHQGKSRTTVAPDKINQAASSTNNKQTIHINQKSDTSAMLTSCAQSSPIDAALRIHSNLMHWAKIE